MVDIPTQPEMSPEDAQQRLHAWYQKQAQLKSLKTHEHLERVALASYFFPNPAEGVNRMDLGGGFDLKLQTSYNYKVSEEDLDQVKAADIKKLKLPWDELIVYKPSLSVSAYRKLNAEQKKFVDQILDIKDASPQMEIVPQADLEGQAKHKAAAEAAQEPVREPDASHGMKIVLDPEEAEAGDYYNDGETWWQLNAEVEWDEIDDEDEVTLLDQLLEDATPPKPAKKRAPRKAKS